MASENKPLAKPTDSETRGVGEELNKQEKIRIQLFQNRQPQPQLPDKTVNINGYIFQIQRGKSVSVPRTVYEVLVQAGEIGPMFDRDEQYVPEVSTQPLA